jgi:hypothetical protein
MLLGVDDPGAQKHLFDEILRNRLTTRDVKERVQAMAARRPYRHADQNLRPEVRAMQDDGFETVDWAKLDDPDGMELVCSPTSSLPGTISGKVDLAYDLMSIGDYDAADIEDIVGMPDVFQRTQLKRASAKLVMKRVGKMLTEGEPWAPPSYINLPEAKILAQQMLCLAEEREVDDERLQLVRDFLVEVGQRMNEGAPPPPPQAQMAPGGPMLGPGAAAPMLPGTAGPPPGASPGPGPGNPMPTMGAAA